MKMLSDTEMIIAELYCHGLIDKEIAVLLDKPVWTVRTHKKHIYTKLGISTTHELVLYMVSVYIGKEWDLQNVRKRGLDAILCLLILFYVFNAGGVLFCQVPICSLGECVRRKDLCRMI